jgi:hypothetical protein
VRFVAECRNRDHCSAVPSGRQRTLPPSFNVQRAFVSFWAELPALIAVFSSSCSAALALEKMRCLRSGPTFVAQQAIESSR